MINSQLSIRRMSNQKIVVEGKFKSKECEHERERKKIQETHQLR